MKVFVSWSGERGRIFADAFCKLLAAAGSGADLEPWMSTRIHHGRPWAAELLARLDECRACVVCVTADAFASPWLSFEAGAVLGAGADPDRIVCLGLDLEPGMLDGHLLARLRLFDVSRESIRSLWNAMLPDTDAAWPEAIWQKFVSDCAAVPDATPKQFVVWLDLQSGLTEHPIQIDRDMAFDDLLQKLLEWRGKPLDALQRAELRCLDFDAERWVSMPRRLSTVHVRRLAILDPEAVLRYRTRLSWLLFNCARAST